MPILGIDVGGTGIKGAPVDTKKGKLLAERFRVLTPQPATPQAVTRCIAEIVKHFRWKSQIGCTFPSVVKNGKIFTAANIHKSWLGVDAPQLIKKKVNCPVKAMNDADAAGLAEMKFGAGKGKQGLVIVVTLGTGIGSALFYKGQLIPNSEIGHIIVRGKDAEDRASNSAREEKNLSWKKWAKRVDEYLCYIEELLWPDLFIIGGGVSKQASKFIPLLHTKAKVVPAKLLNEAGIIGAALAAEQD